VFRVHAGVEHDPGIAGFKQIGIRADPGVATEALENHVVSRARMQGPRGTVNMSTHPD
jgi:hypothetical protein